MNATNPAPKNTLGSLATDVELIPPETGFDYQQLGNYITGHLKASKRCEDDSNHLAKQSTVHKWYAGAALNIVRQREARDGKWVEWCKAHSLNLGTCYEAIRLWKRSGSIENVQDLSITEARRKYQTHKKSYLGPDEPKPATKTNPKVVPEKIYNETDHLRGLREECEKLIESVANVEDPEWEHANPVQFIGFIDRAIERLRLARRAIRTAEKAKPAATTAQKNTQADGASKSSPHSSGDELVSILDSKSPVPDGDASATKGNRSRVKSKS